MVAKVDPFKDISLPVGAVRTTEVPNVRLLPLTVKLVVEPAVPWVVVGNVNEVLLTFSVGVTAAVVKLPWLQ